MTNTPASKRSKSRELVQRSGQDRRKVDNPPPVKVDRRRSVDARKPDVVELEMTDSEWSALNQLPLLPAKRP
jgi:hypothetical protein